RQREQGRFPRGEEQSRHPSRTRAATGRRRAGVLRHPGGGAGVIGDLRLAQTRQLHCYRPRPRSLPPRAEGQTEPVRGAPVENSRIVVPVQPRLTLIPTLTFSALSSLLTDRALVDSG